MSNISLQNELTIENLRFSYDKNKVLKGIDFSAKAGELIFILGPNGIGKTTLFRCMLGLLKGYSGRIVVDGIDIREMRTRELAEKIAYIPQAHDPTFGYSVLDMVLMGDAHKLSVFSSPGEKSQLKALGILKHLEIEKLAYKCFSKLSGGEQQLVLTARALMQETGIILMDEPTSNLDYGNQLRLLQRIKNLSREGYIILLSSHNPQHALSFADRVLAMYDGTLISDGRPDDIIDKELFSKLYKTEVDFYDTPGGRVVISSVNTESIENKYHVKSKFIWNDDMIRFMADASEHGKYYEELASILSGYITPDALVCDAGCGLGYLSLALSQYCRHITAIDISEKALGILRENIRAGKTTEIDSCRNIYTNEGNPVINDFKNEILEDKHEIKSENNKYKCEKHAINFHNITVEHSDLFTRDNDDMFDCIIFSFFGDTRESLKIAEKLCRPGGRVIMIKKDWYIHRFSLSENKIDHHTLEETLIELQKMNVKAELKHIELEMGQPLRSIQDAVRFYRTYSHDEDQDGITEEAVMEKLVENRSADSGIFPYYLPQKKAMGIFIIDM